MAIVVYVVGIYVVYNLVCVEGNIRSKTCTHAHYLRR
jgi:hypothetical protein